MKQNQFKDFAANKKNSKWGFMISRAELLQEKKGDTRSPFARDYTRILHSFAYRRLKHKTQVFFNVEDDHICTRMEHVAHVDSVSTTIAKTLGLNEELTRAIAIGHDIGHAPFGHTGEGVLKKIVKTYISQTDDFWHEKNGLRFVDSVELLEDSYKQYKNLNLTYAVRDGIISHCGEVNQNGIIPREDYIDLYDFDTANKYQPYTWEGCVVKLSDKIAYLGRDVEDAIRLGFLDEEGKQILLDIARQTDKKTLNTTTIIYTLITDVCKNSSPDKGICLSDECLDLLNSVKDFNYKYIYDHDRFRAYKKYSNLIIQELFDYLFNLYPAAPSSRSVWENLQENKRYYPSLISSFEYHLAKLCMMRCIPEGHLRNYSSICKNEKIYGNLGDKKVYAQAIVDFISGMTDRFAIKLFDELISFKSVV